MTPTRIYTDSLGGQWFAYKTVAGNIDIHCLSTPGGWRSWTDRTPEDLSLTVLRSSGAFPDEGVEIDWGSTGPYGGPALFTVRKTVTITVEYTGIEPVELVRATLESAVKARMSACMILGKVIK